MQLSLTAKIPDHLEPRGWNDMLIDEWCEYDRSQMKAFQVHLIHLNSAYCQNISPELRAGMVGYLNLDKTDVMIAGLRAERERFEHSFWSGRKGADRYKAERT